jgi:hypothetical protein
MRKRCGSSWCFRISVSAVVSLTTLMATTLLTMGCGPPGGRKFPSAARDPSPEEKARIEEERRIRTLINSSFNRFAASQKMQDGRVTFTVGSGCPVDFDTLHRRYLKSQPTIDDFLGTTGLSSLPYKSIERDGNTVLIFNGSDCGISQD